MNPSSLGAGARAPGSRAQCWSHLVQSTWGIDYRIEPNDADAFDASLDLMQFASLRLVRMAGDTPFVAHRRGPVHADQAFLLGDVLQQEVLHVLVWAVGVDRRDPLREVADVVIVLLDPFAEQAAVQLARGPGIAPRMHRRVALFDGVFQCETKRAL